METTMSQGTLKMSKFEPEKSEMSELVCASKMMRERIAPPGSADSKGERIMLASRLLRWKLSRAASVWYADERVSLKPRELRKVEEISGVKYAREELRTNDDLIANAEALLAGHEADFYSAFIAALRAVARSRNSSGAER
jgi:hypothetical protein